MPDIQAPTADTQDEVREDAPCFPWCFTADCHPGGACEVTG